MKVFDFEDQTDINPRTLIGEKYIKNNFLYIECFFNSSIPATKYIIKIKVNDYEFLIYYATQNQRDKVYNRFVKHFKLKAGKK